MTSLVASGGGGLGISGSRLFLVYVSSKACPGPSGLRGLGVLGLLRCFGFEGFQDVGVFRGLGLRVAFGFGSGCRVQGIRAVDHVVRWSDEGLGFGVPLVLTPGFRD